MTVANTLRRAGPFTGDGVTVVFPFTFKVFANTDVVVTELTISTGVEAVKTLTTHYSVTLNPDQNTSPGGVVTAVAAPSAAVKWTLSSAVPALQGSSLSTGGGFYPEVIEAALDKAIILLQDLQEQSGRSLLSQISTPVGATLPAPEANKAIAWNGSATGLQNVTLGGAGAVSSFMEPVILAVDAADARSQLSAAKSGVNADITSMTALASLTALASINGGQLAGTRNRVINSGCLVAQGVSPTLSSTPQYGVVDRYLLSATGTGVSGTVQQVSTSQFPVTGVGIGTVGSWTSGVPQVEHRIEAKNTIDLNGRSVTISGRVFHTLGSTRSMQVRLNRPTTTEDVFSAQTTLATSSAFSCPDSVGTAFSFTVALGATDASKGLAIQVFDSAASTVASKIFAISELTLEPGAVVTPFENKMHGNELALCQRYYYRMNSSAGAARIFGMGSALTTSIPQFFTQFPVEMRANPTVFEQSGNAADYEVYWGGGPTACTGVPTNYAMGAWGASYRFATGATLVGNSAVLAQSKTTSAYLGWRAEL